GSYAGLQTTHDAQPPNTRAVHVRAIFVGVKLWLDRDGNGNVLRRADTRRAVKTFSRHTDNSKRHVVEIDLFANDCCIATKPLLPVTMTQNRNWRGPGFVVLIIEHTTNRRLHTERCVVIPGHSLSVRNLRLTIGGDIQSDISKREDVGHWAFLLAQALVRHKCEGGPVNETGLLILVGAAVV